MTYEVKWKTVIDKAWDTHKKKWEAENPDSKMTESRFSFMNTFLQEKYKEESEEVKDEVRKRRVEMKENGHIGKDIVEAEKVNQAYQK
jgi:uncharacterized protein YijF (DUF1287 family)